MKYRITITLCPNSDDPIGYQRKEFQDSTVWLANEFEHLFASRCKWMGKSLAEGDWVTKLACLPHHHHLYFEIQKWFRETPHLAQGSYVGGCGSPDPSTIASARWVSLAAISSAIDCRPGSSIPINKYPIQCKTCGWGNFDAVPDPYRISSPAKINPKNLGREIFSAHNGIFIVNQRVRDLFIDLTGVDVDTGPVVIDGQNKPDKDFFWIRPKKHIGACSNMLATGAVCYQCNRYDRYSLDIHNNGGFLNFFGDTAANFARIGDVSYFHPAVDSRDVPRRHAVAVSGSLYAALYNHGVKGLCWPDGGPFISVLESEPPAETRRYVNLFSKTKDKIMKVAVSEASLFDPTTASA